MTFIDFENYKNNRYDHQVESEGFDNDHAIDKMTAVSLRYELEESTFDLLDQDYVHRWNGRHMIKSQNLAEHQAHTAQYLIALFSVFLRLSFATYHTQFMSNTQRSQRHMTRQNKMSGMTSIHCIGLMSKRDRPHGF